VKLSKNIYIGTGGGFFFIINITKIPMHILAWETISFQSLLFDLLMIIPIIAGAVSGFYTVKQIPENPSELSLFSVHRHR
jgi:uncharacterized protein